MPPLLSLQDAMKQQEIVSSEILPVRGFKEDAKQSASLRDQLIHLKLGEKTILQKELPPPAPVLHKHKPAAQERGPRTRTCSSHTLSVSGSSLGMPPTPSLRRRLSEPKPAVEAQQTSQRRAIFNRYWKQDNECIIAETEPARMRPVPSQSPPIQGRPRSVSLPEDCYPNYDLSFRDFCPPPGCALEHREHYGWVENLPEESEACLPPLPLPLQRFYCDGRVSSLRGMYPMVSPKSILRQSSYPSPSPSLLPVPNSNGAGVTDSFNLTRSGSSVARPAADVVMGRGRCDEDTSETSSNTCSCCSSSGGRRGVSFDPRITVTEFEDNLQRPWFTDAELDRFRMETVIVAQKYLLKHPEMIDVYNKPRLDPITGTMRKKALYSMPALSCSMDTEEETQIQESQGDLIRYRRAMKDLADHEVKKILVVDRNKLILDLFRRSLHTLFPHAQIVTAQSSEQALRLFCSAIPPSSPSPSAPPRTPYDIVIAEERLHQPLSDSRTPVLTSGKSCVQLRGSRLVDQFLTERSTSLQDLSSCACAKKPQQQQGLSGSELLRRISSLEDAHHAAQQAQSSAEASSWFEPGIWRALLIGVSIQPQQDEAHLRESGADLVWGKPPPHMDEHLRDEIVARLIQKRENSVVAGNAADSR